MTRIARFRLAVLAATALVSSSPVLTTFADLPRHAINGVPFVGGGHKVERFLLLEVVHISHPGLRRRDAMEYWMLPGIFAPVAEDAEGVYYQSTTGFRVYAGYRPQVAEAGGLYVSKGQANRIWPYIGDAKRDNEALAVDQFQLLADKLQKLKVGRAEHKR
ncbi:MAG: hypothetical protein WAO00_03610 [Chthoniobacterales bacterium]